jgi:hypothetical protein
MAHPDDTTVRLGADALRNLPRADGLMSVCSGTTASQHEDAATGDNKKKSRSRASRSVRSLDINI